MDKKEIVDPPIKGSKIIMQFLERFSCLNCGEIGDIPCFLKCNHIYCEKCASIFYIKQKDGSMNCPFCYEITKKEESLPEFEMRLLLLDLFACDDETFFAKYKNKLDFNSEVFNFRDNILFLLQFFSLNNKFSGKNNGKKKCIKRTYMELKNDKFNNNNHYNFKETKGKLFFKGY